MKSQDPGFKARVSGGLYPALRGFKPSASDAQLNATVKRYGLMLRSNATVMRCSPGPPLLPLSKTVRSVMCADPNHLDPQRHLRTPQQAAVMPPPALCLPTTGDDSESAHWKRPRTFNPRIPQPHLEPRRHAPIIPLKPPQHFLPLSGLLLRLFPFPPFTSSGLHHPRSRGSCPSRACCCSCCRRSFLGRWPWGLEGGEKVVWWRFEGGWQQLGVG